LLAGTRLVVGYNNAENSEKKMTKIKCSLIGEEKKRDLAFFSPDKSNNQERGVFTYEELVGCIQ